jgi:hypothetical protein
LLSGNLMECCYTEGKKNRIQPGYVIFLDRNWGVAVE